MLRSVDLEAVRQDYAQEAVSIPQGMERRILSLQECQSFVDGALSRLYLPDRCNESPMTRDLYVKSTARGSCLVYAGAQQPRMIVSTPITHG